MKYTIGVDVGGTNTDAALICDHQIKCEAKVITSEDVTTGIAEAIRRVLNQQQCDVTQIDAVMVGTTHLINALLQAKYLEPVMVLRLAAPASTAAPIGIGWNHHYKQAMIADCSQIISGGYEFDGRVISQLNKTEIIAAAEAAGSAGITRVAIVGVFSHVNPSQEHEVKAILQAVNPEFKFSLSHELGNLGLLTRENASIVNASLGGIFEQLYAALYQMQASMNLQHAKLYLSNSTGTLELLTADDTQANPIAVLSSGPTNSIRGAVMVGETSAIVIDIGGTSTEFGMLRDKFPVLENIPFELVPGSGMVCQFPKPRVISIALGGGSTVHWAINPAQDVIEFSIGPESVGRALMSQAICFGGTVLTVTDIAYVCHEPFRAQLQSTAGVNIRPIEVIKQIVQAQLINNKININKFFITAYEYLHKLISTNFLSALASIEDYPRRMVLIGGGAMLFDAGKLCYHMKLPNLQIAIAEHAGVINAAGAAVAQVSINESKIYDYTDVPRALALYQMLMLGMQQLLSKSARLESINIAGRGIHEAHLDYLLGNLNEVSITLVGDITFDAIDNIPYDQPNLIKQVEQIMREHGFQLPAGASISFAFDANRSTKHSTKKTINPTSQIDSTNLINSKAATNQDIEFITWLDNKLAQKKQFTTQVSFTSQAIRHIACGANFLGSGGGGSAELGSLMAQWCIEQGYVFDCIHLDQLNMDDYVIGFGMMGSPVVFSERLPAIEEGAKAIYTFEQKLGKPIAAILITEIGGANAVYPLFVAARLGLPVIDADCMGRAFPQLNMVYPNIVSAYHDAKDINPLLYCAALANSSGVAFIGADISSKANSLESLEDIARRETVNKGGVVSIAYLPMPVSVARSCMLPGSLSVAQYIGKIMLQAINNQRLNTAEIMRELKAYLRNTPYARPEKQISCLASGRINHLVRREIDGFAIGGARIITKDGVVFEVGFQNENLFVRKQVSHQQYEKLVVVPDIITLVDVNTFFPIACEQLRYGQEVLIMSMPVSAQLYTAKALSILGIQAYPITIIERLLDDSALHKDALSTNRFTSYYCDDSQRLNQKRIASEMQESRTPR